MSRTDKDAPMRVRAEWFTPDHYNCPFDIPRRIFWQRYSLNECTLPPEPTRSRSGDPRWWFGRKTWPCTWEPVNPDPHHRYRGPWSPSPVFRRVLYWKPDRARVRRACEQARAEYNTFGDTDVEVPLFQHRHAETIGGGWWD